MKKLILLLAIIFATVNISISKPVPAVRANTVALTFIKKYIKNASIKNTIIEKESDGKTVDDYIVNINPKGYVIVSGDDNARAVSAFSTETNWVDPSKDPNGSNIAFYHNAIKNSIHDVIVNKRKATSKISKDWVNYSSGKLLTITAPAKTTAPSIPPLVQSTWNQSPYYNEYCPGGSVTGCVANAMAQVMRYWKCPIRGNGNSSYTSGYGILTANYDTAYPWNLMSLNLSGATPADSVSAVAFLEYQIGISVEMQYSPSGSGAYVLTTDGGPGTACAQTSYTEYFGFNPNTIKGVIKENFAIAKWDSIINVELNAARPVEYVGFGDDGGHTWVLDGYENVDSFYHMNWGWGGLDNGYFTLDGLNPSGIPLGSENEMLVGLEPANLNPCTSPSNLTVTNITDSTILLNWTTGGSASSYNIEYQQIGSSVWTTIQNAQEPYLINKLLHGTNYQIEVQQVCTNTGLSQYIGPVDFTTLGSLECIAPTISQVWASSYDAEVVWNQITSATSYEIQYKLPTASSWTNIFVGNTKSYTITNLLPNTIYNLQMKSICAIGDTSAPSNSNNGGFGLMTTYPPCALPTFISTDSIGNTAFKLVWNKDAYPMQQFVISIDCPNCSVPGWNDAYTVPGNVLYSWNDLPEPGTWTCTLGADCANGGSITSAPITFTTTDSMFLAEPINLTTTNITDTGVDLSWSAIDSADWYDVQLNTGVSGPVWYPTVNHIHIGGLIPNTLYIWEVQSESYYMGISHYSSTETFYTLPLVPLSCYPVTNLVISNITTNSATVTWTAAKSDSIYLIQYKPEYLQTWNTVTTTATTYNLTNLISSYTFNIQVATICSKHDTSTWNTSLFNTLIPSTLSTSISSQTNILCYGNNTGSATVTATGGTSPYTYSWNTSPVQTAATATGLSAGTYTVTVTDAANNKSSSSVIITQPILLNILIISKNLICYGNNIGTATTTVSGGTSPYTYSWNTSPVQTTATAIGLAAGTYTVTVTDANGCKKTSSVIITQPSILTSSVTTKNILCYGGNTGSATVTATGGTSPYTYSWNTSPAQTSATATGLSAGTYVVTVTDANNCTATNNIIITQPSIINVIITQTTNSATATVSGGTSPYTYSWNTSPVQTTATAIGLAAGTYTVTVTDANECLKSTTIVIAPIVCNVATNISTSLIGISGATISWSSVSDSIYLIQYRMTGVSTWTKVYSITNKITLTGLVQSKQYQLEIQTICSKNSSSAFSTPITFNTLPVSYCPDRGNVTYEYIKNIKLNTINNSTKDNGYGNYLNQTTTLSAGKSYTITLTPGFNNNDGPYTEYWSVYIDYNETGFAGIVLISPAIQGISTNTSSISIPFTVPATAINGSTRIRIIIHRGSYDLNPCLPITNGDVQDYVVVISGGIAVPPPKLSK